MSTYFNLSCLDCKQDREGFGDIRDEHILRYLIEHRKVFEVEEMQYFDIRIGLENVNFGWFREHREHRIAVRCEYENFEDLEVREKTGLSWRDYTKRER